MVYTEEYIQSLYELLEPLVQVTQEPQYHPEANAYVHSFQVLYHALRETDDTDLILAALMHDVGKTVNKLGHDKESVTLMTDCASAKTLWLIGNHMRINHYLDGSMRKLSKATDFFSHPWFPLVVSLNRWDRMGRRANWSYSITAAELADRLNDKVLSHFRVKPS